MDVKTNQKVNRVLRLIRILLVLCPSIWVVTLVLQWKFDPDRSHYPYRSVILGWGVWDFILMLIACVLVWRSLSIVREKGFFDPGFIKTLNRVKWLVVFSVADELLGTITWYSYLKNPIESFLDFIQLPLFLLFGLLVLIKILQTGHYLLEEQKWMV